MKKYLLLILFLFPISSFAYTLQFSLSNSTPADASNYYAGNTIGLSADTTADIRRIYIPTNGIIDSIYGAYDTRGTLGSAGFATLKTYIRINNTDEYIVASTTDLSIAKQTFASTTMNIPVNAGDYIEIKYNTPSWNPTNPTTVYLSGSVHLSQTGDEAYITNNSTTTIDTDPLQTAIVLSNAFLIFGLFLFGFLFYLRRTK